jgi:hypothetical protein
MAVPGEFAGEELIAFEGHLPTMVDPFVKTQFGQK